MSACAHPYKNTRLAGQASVEAAVCIFAVLALLWLVVQTTQWFVLRQHLLLHSQRAAEQSAMSGGRPETAFKYLNEHLQPRSLILASVCVIDEVPDLMADFRDAALSRELGYDAIRHSHVAAQHQKNVARGWPEGKGPRSEKSIAQANLLNLSVTAYQPVNMLWLRSIVGRHLRVRVTVRSVMQSSRRSVDQPCISRWLPD